jgi:hypothetical protein
MHRQFLLVLSLILWLTLPTPAAESVRVLPPEFRDARQPQVAVDPAGKVYLVFGVEDAIYCTVSEDGGTSYRLPVKVAEEGSLSLGMRRGPRVAATGSGVIVTAIYGKVGRGKDGDLLAWRSTDGGKTWPGPVKVNRVEGSAREGLHGMAAAPDGTISCVWIDLREGKSQVYGTASTDGGVTWQPDRLIYASPEGNICPCCQPVAAFDPRGNLHVMWRNDLAGARDMYLVSSPDGGRTFGSPRKLGEGTWPHRT